MQRIGLKVMMRQPSIMAASQDRRQHLHRVFAVERSDTVLVSIANRVVGTCISIFRSVCWDEARRNCESSFLDGSTRMSCSTISSRTRRYFAMLAEKIKEKGFGERLMRL